MTDRNRNEVWGRVFFDELVRHGVEHVCLAPGSRSTPLVLAAAERPELRVHPFLDERSAAFFALGVAKASTRPVAMITTSGTAVANLFPAVVEASHAEVPLLLLTADRPRHLRDGDANQTIDQVRIFGGYVRSFIEAGPPEVGDVALRHLRVTAARAFAECLGAPAGPVHVNFPFAKPLEPLLVPDDVPDGFERAHPLAAFGRTGCAPFTRVSTRRPRLADEEVEEIASALRRSNRPLVVAGPAPDPLRRGRLLRRLSRAGGLPLLADPLSGARTGREEEGALVAHYDLFLRDDAVLDRLAPDLILRVGGAPTSAALLRYLGGVEGSVPQLVVDVGGAWKDHLSTASRYFRGEPEDALLRIAASVARQGGDGGTADWTALWLRAERVAERVSREGAAGVFFEGALFAEVSEALPPEGALFVSSSMPVRDLDAFGGDAAAGGAIYGNRGASGIDGIVSTACGVSLGRGTPVLAVVGDVAFHHDMNGLLAAREAGVRVVFVVVHNDGGGIFQMLPIREHEPAFTRYFSTPHGLDFRHAAALYGLPFRRVEGRSVDAGGSTGEDSVRGRFAEALRWALSEETSVVVEVRADREENRSRRAEVVKRVAEAVRDELELEREVEERR